MSGNLIAIIVILVLLLVLAGIIYYAYCNIRKKLRDTSRMLFGTDSMIEGMKQREKEVEMTPKSVSSATNLYMPSIMRDFPEFNWVQFKNKAEDALKLSLMAISAHSIGRAESLSEALKEEVAARIEQNQTAGVNEVYERIHVHQTEIARYEKQKGKCIITLQSAVEHIH